MYFIVFMVLKVKLMYLFNARNIFNVSLNLILDTVVIMY